MKQNILQALPGAQTLQQCQNADEEIFRGGDTAHSRFVLCLEGTSPYTRSPRHLDLCAFGARTPTFKLLLAPLI